MIVTGTEFLVQILEQSLTQQRTLMFGILHAGDDRIGDHVAPASVQGQGVCTGLCKPVKSSDQSGGRRFKYWPSFLSVAKLRGKCGIVAASMH